jgi:crotonobetainyl-CoA:carnitine CoA-transferase CaiB-like acyl-CoA transferase
MRDPRGLQMMHKLTDSADVFVENYRPGALNKLGLGYDELSKRNEKLVYCSVSAYGHTGPDAARAATAVPHADCRYVRGHARRVGHLCGTLRSR